MSRPAVGALLLALLVAVSCWIQEKPQEFEGCYDGDTCSWTHLDRSVRFARVDAPEMDGPNREAAIAARDTIRSLIRHAQAVRIHKLCVGIYDRWIAEVYVDGTNLSDWLLAHGFAERYTGPTCPDG